MADKQQKVQLLINIENKEESKNYIIELNKPVPLDIICFVGLFSYFQKKK